MHSADSYKSEVKKIKSSIKMSMLKPVPSTSKSEKPSSSNDQKSSINKKYQVLLAKILFIRGYFKKLKNFQLETNAKDVDVFGDVIFHDEKSCYLIQINCFEQNDKSKISAKDLFDAENGIFSLLRYVCAYKEIKSNGRLKDLHIQNCVFLTNIPFDFEININGKKSIFDSESQNLICFKEIPSNGENILQLQSDTLEINYYRIKYKNLIKILFEKAKILKNSVVNVEFKTTLENLTENDIQEALEKIMFIIIEDSVVEFKNSVDRLIEKEFKRDLSAPVLVRLDEFIIKLIDQNNVLTFDDAASSINENIKMGIELGLHGSMYSVAVVMFLCTRAYFRKLTNFSLETEVAEASKFDDVVFSEDSQNYRFMQLKHRQYASDRKITGRDIFDDLNGDFSLIKYVCAYWMIKDTSKFRKVPIKDTIIFTNLNFESHEKFLSRNLKEYFQNLTEIDLEQISLDENDILKVQDFPVKYYKLNNKEVATILLRIKGSFKNRHVYVPNMKEVLNNLDQHSIEEALQHIIFAVGQPNKDELFGLIKKELKDYFNIYSADNMFYKLKDSIIDWCGGAENFPPKITYDVIETFFQKNTKTFQFEIPSPSQMFVGRKSELKEIRAKLQCGTLIISGPPGVGKTEITKQFVAEYKEADYYSRVIWIDSGNNDTIDMKLERIFSELKLELPENLPSDGIETIKHKINQILDYFKDMKILFVFDNVDKPNEDFDILLYFRQVISVMQNKPHILITIINNEYGGKNVQRINLNKLPEKEAVDWLEKSLSFIQQEENVIRDLIRSVDRVPLLIKQAIAYIIQEHYLAENINKHYKISQFIKDYHKNPSLLLNFKFKDDFGYEHSQTMYNTWNSTLDIISKDRYGEDAITMLQYTAYLNTDDINLNLLKPFVKMPQEINKTLRLFFTHNMMSIDEDGKKEKSTLKIDRVLQKVVRTKNEQEQKDIKIIQNLLSNKNPSVKIVGNIVIVKRA